MKIIQLFLITTSLIGGTALILYAAVPANFSPLGTLQTLANRTAGDGVFDFQLETYQNSQRFSLMPGLILLLLGMLILVARRKKAARPLTVLTYSGLAFFGICGLLVVNLALGRSKSFVYKQMFGVAPTPTPAPSTSIPDLVPTLVLEGSREWKHYAKEFDKPVALVSPDDGSGRLFVVEKSGLIRIIENGKVLEEPFLNLIDRSIQKIISYEQGLLGLAFHPDYEENGFFYISYIDLQNNTVISRFQVSDEPNQADPNSELQILGLFQPSGEHNGGTIKFGPDGYFYIGFGDGGRRKETLGHAQSLDTLFGKLVRINVDGGTPYAIPTDNPFANTYGRGEIYHYGLRNPWQYSWDPLTGDLYIADVGQNFLEEIDFVPADQTGGLNFGWGIKEGFSGFNWALGTAMPAKELTEPVWAYKHAGVYCSITGGQVYRADLFPELKGWYLFGDFCSGVIWGIRQGIDGTWEHKTFFDTRAQITSFYVDQAGNLFITDLKGFIWKLHP